MFAVFVRDVSEYAVALHGQASATKEQQAGALSLVRRPSTDPQATAALHEEITRYAS
jgi:acyl-CoA dehydrogenase